MDKKAVYVLFQDGDKSAEYSLPGCDYVADTRDGFEDNPVDTKWVAEYFMPKAKEYGCQIIYFIIDGENSLKDELEGQEKDSSALLEFRYIYGIEEVNNGS